MRRLVFVALAGVAAVAVPAVVAITRDEDAAHPLEAAADEVVAQGVPGVVVRLRTDDETTMLARGEASADDRFRVGSVTKTFVAALALALADAGRLDLDDPVSQHVPRLLRDGNRITVRQLLGHTAGLYDYTNEPALLKGDLSPRELVAIADRRERSDGYAYSSTNYLALGLVLEAVGGAPLEELLRRHVFRPFGLAHTSFEPGRVSGRYLHGHERSARDGVATGQLRDTDLRTARSAWAAGAGVSTASDLDRFFMRLLASDLGRRMAPGGDARYGLGLARFDTECGPVVGHTGNVLGMVTVVWARGDRVLVAGANAFPLTQAQETAFGALLTRAICD